MYESKKEIFNYYEEIDFGFIKNLAVLKTLREKIKKIVEKISYGEIIAMENTFRIETNERHRSLCAYLKEFFKENNFPFREHVLFYYNSFSSNENKKIKSCGIVEPDFLVYSKEEIGVIEVKSSNNGNNLKKGVSQLLLTDFLINYCPLSSSEYSWNAKKGIGLYLVTKGRLYPNFYKIGDEAKYCFYENLRNYLANSLKRRKSLKNKFVRDLVDILSVVKERI